MKLEEILEGISEDHLREIVEKISIPRHGWYNYNELKWVAEFVESKFREFGYLIDIDEFSYQGRLYKNIIATKEGVNSRKDWLVIGAHYDSAVDSPGADDNGSGVAVMLEVARVLRDVAFVKNIKFLAFSLEEPQPFSLNFLIGSSHFVKKMKKLKYKYEAIILESVGYFSTKEGSQQLPAFVSGPSRGDFLGVIGNRKSIPLLRLFDEAKKAVPTLNLITYKAPLSGWLVIETRFSDHASFWNAGYQAVMLTDTAMFRNPYYHTNWDTPDKLNFSFMRDVAKVIVSATFLKYSL
ncbi:MAG: M28 family peptidase [Thermodesulfovibrio sp.]|nr:M28 family peptidase [Thermodesulfovibrio sp.]